MTLTTLDFNSLQSGAVVADQFASSGVLVRTQARVNRGSNGDAMIFDTDNPTGGDCDLGFEGRGGALIISEDGDQDDPDDDRCGGYLTFDFSEPADTQSITILDGEEGGAIRAFDADGNQIGLVVIPPGADNDARVFDLDFEGVSSLRVYLKGSGAVDDLVFSRDDGPTEPVDVEVEVSGETADGTDVTFGVTTPATTASTTSSLTASLTLGTGEAETNVVFVIDVSGSTGGGFVGTAVGDANGDGFANTILDAEIASLVNLSDAIEGLAGDGDIGVGLVEFESDARLIGDFTAGSPELAAALGARQELGLTNYAAALQTTLDYFEAQNAAGDNNIVYFLSDGFPNAGGDYSDEVAALESQFNAQIIGVGVGGNSSLFDLDLIDNTGPGAEQVLTTDALDTTLLGSPIPEIADFFVFVNGVEQTGIDETDLIDTAFGYSLPETAITGLDPTLGADNSVVARITLDDGTVLDIDATITGAGFIIGDPFS